MTTNIEKLKFPSGRPVSAARKDAKKLSKAEGLTLVEAQNCIAVANGLNMRWDEAIQEIKCNQPTLADFDSPTAPVILERPIPLLTCKEAIAWASSGEPYLDSFTNKVEFTCSEKLSGPRVFALMVTSPRKAVWAIDPDASEIPMKNGDELAYCSINADNAACGPVYGLTVAGGMAYVGDIAVLAGIYLGKGIGVIEETGYLEKEEAYLEGLKASKARREAELLIDSTPPEPATVADVTRVVHHVLDQTNGFMKGPLSIISVVEVVRKEGQFYIYLRKVGVSVAPIILDAEPVACEVRQFKRYGNLSVGGEIRSNLITAIRAIEKEKREAPNVELWGDNK